MFRLTSNAFEDERAIPTQHTGEGKDTSPPLAWTDPPRGTQAFALVCDDPDAPAGDWVHWLIYDLPPERHALPENVPKWTMLGDGGKQGRNSWDNIGYQGPKPPRGDGPHHYHFHLYALSRPCHLPQGSTKQQLLDAIRHTILAEAELTGLYERYKSN